MYRLRALLLRGGLPPVPEYGRWKLFSSIFFSFTIIGWLSALSSMTQTLTVFSASVSATLSGMIAIMYGLVVSLRWWWMLPIALLFHIYAAPWIWNQLAMMKLLAILPKDLDPSPTRTVQMALGICCVAIGQTLLISYINTIARRGLAIRAEVEQAQRIHEAVVSPCHLRRPGLEIIARTTPSAKIGGDLIDVVENDACVDVFVADVAGHGVGAGLISGMVKSAVRMELGGAVGSLQTPLQEIVRRLNLVLADLTRPEMFVTFACVRLSRDQGERWSRMECVLAGHPPIFVWRSELSNLEEITNAALPLGIERNTSFVCFPCTLEPGDVAMIFTDGLNETFAKSGEQFGLTRLADVLATVAQRAGSLESMHEEIVAAVSAFGPQTDDRTLVLLRVGNDVG